jgi:hypothetical protein
MNTTVRMILQQRDTGFPEQAAEFSRAAEVLHIATRSWPVLPPSTRAEVDAVSAQISGLQHALIGLKTIAQK